jgi:cytochrome c-type biogenesis protein
LPWRCLLTATGGFVIYLAGTGTMTGGPGFQVAIGRLLTRVFARIQIWITPVPETVLGLGLLALAAVFVVATLRDRHRRSPARRFRPRQTATPTPPRVRSAP